ncbi:MAG: helix-turn-helix transcriptional regulator [Candidatus Auribacterota bacterium]|nr:helix-turn-helix transcriptional regulator [Candidatus Auribacterota bacterium]
MARRSHSVAEMAADILGDPSAKKDVEKLIANRRLIEQLTLQRLLRNKSQTEVAKHMGCNSSKISRMEAGFDHDLKFGDILSYLSALGMGLSMTLTNPTSPISDRIKHAVFQVDDLLKELTKLALLSGDEQITSGIDRFYHEVLFNFIKNFQSTYDEFRDRSQISFPKEKPDEGDFEEQASSPKEVSQRELAGAV